MDSTTESKRIYCNSCRRLTNHVARGSHTTTDVDEDYYFEETATLWTCAGCEAATLEEAAGVRLQDEEPVINYTYSPDRTSAKRPTKVFRRLPKPLRLIYREVVTAYNRRLHILCAAGLRGLIEGICEDKNIKGRNLETRIDSLVDILPRNIVVHLHGFRFMGNEALHKLGSPDRKNLRIAIEVSEDLLNFLYELDYKASRLPRKAGSQPTDVES